MEFISNIKKIPKKHGKFSQRFIIVILCSLFIAICAIYAEKLYANWKNKNIHTWIYYATHHVNEFKVNIEELLFTGYEIDKTSFISTNYDPQIFQSNINQDIASITITFAKPLESMINITVYYSEYGENLSEKNIIRTDVQKDETYININLNKHVEMLRYDICNLPNQKFELDSIVFNKKMQTTDIMTNIFTIKSIYKMSIIFFICFFILINFIVNISIYYDFIYRYRYILCVIVFFIFVINKIHFSSISMIDNYIQPNNRTEFSTPIWGTARPIRSDEWLVGTPNILSSQYSPDAYGRYNYIMRGTKTENMASRTYISFATLANPLFFGYIFGPEYGISIHWCGTLLITFMVLLEIMYIISKGNRLLSVTGACLVTFSPFYQWWSYGPVWIVGGIGTIVCLYYYIQSNIYIKKIFFALGISVFFSQFVVNLYPPWQVPSGYLFLGLAIWVIYENKIKIKQFRKFDWCIISLTLAFTITIIITYLMSLEEYMTVILNTVYPGSRIDTGGITDIRYFLDRFMNGGLYAFLTLSQQAVANTNVCEFGGFNALFPIPLISTIYFLIKKRQVDLLSIILFIYTVFIGSYILVGWPEWLAKLSLMSSSMPSRAMDVVLFSQVFLLIRSLSSGNDCKNNEKIISWKKIIESIIISIGILIEFIYFCKLDFGRLMSPILSIVVFVGITLVIYCIITQYYNKRIFIVACIYLIGFSCISGMRVHPFMKGLDAIYGKPLASKVKELAQNTDEKWIALDSLVNQQFLIACGASTINSTNIYPNISLWERLDSDNLYKFIYNRYAHVAMYLTADKTRFELAQADVISIYLSYDDLSTVNVKFIFSPYALEDCENVNFELLYNEDGAWIYGVELQ